MEQGETYIGAAPCPAGGVLGAEVSLGAGVCSHKGSGSVLENKAVITILTASAVRTAGILDSRVVAMQIAIVRGTLHVAGAAGLGAGVTGIAVSLCGLVASLTLCQAKCWVH